MGMFAGVELEEAERPDQAIRLAFERATDRKAVIRQGVAVARYIRGSRTGIALITPWPTPYEAIDVWAGSTDSVSRSLSNARAVIVATIIGVPSTYAACDHRALFLVVFVLAAIIRLSIAWVVRRRAARLDEDSALALVLALIAEGTNRRPRHAARVMKYLR